MKTKATDHKATDHFAWLPQEAKAKLGVRYAAHQTRMRSDIYNTATNPDGKKEIEMKYTVRDSYGICDETTHHSFKDAVTARNRRKGDGWEIDGWEIYDTDGNRVEPYYRPVSGGGWEAVPERV